LEIPVGAVLFFRDLAIAIAINLIVSLSLNLEFGFTGIPNFGKVLSVAGGAFTAGFLPGRIATWVYGIELSYVDNNAQVVAEINKSLIQDPLFSISIFVVTIAIAALVGAVLGFIASYPAIRLREDYLSITLLAMGEAIQVIGYNYTPLIGGTLGVRIPNTFLWVENFGLKSLDVVGIIIICVSVFIFIYLERLVRTPLGRMLRAIRDSEDAAESLGKDVTRIRMKTIMVASMIGAIGGALYAFRTVNVISKSYSRGIWTFWPWVMVIVGGAANNRGVLLGTFGFVTTRRLIDFYKSALDPFLPFNVIWLDYLLLGIILILVQFYRPDGIITEKPTLTISKEKLSNLAESDKSDTKM
jgi:branched-chain amino acid transport system permease protein